MKLVIRRAAVIAVGFLSCCFGWAQCNTSGCLDPTFGPSGNGMVATNVAGVNWIRRLAIQSDGRLVASGSAYDPGTNTTNFGTARFNDEVTGQVDGSLDSTFGAGTGAVASTGIGGGSSGVAIDTMGRIAIAGSDYILRYNSDGSPDNTFNGTGIRALNDGSSLLAISVQSWDNRVLVAGQSSNGLSYLARLNSDGSLDTSFGNKGVVTTSFGRNYSSDIWSLAIQPADHKIVAAGNAAGGFGVARYNTNGSLDTAFGSSGLVRTTTFLSQDSSGARAAALDASGNVVVGGIVSYKKGPQDFGVARYLPNGQLDTKFGGGGVVTTHFSSGNDVAFAIAIQSNGEIVVVGNAVVGSATDFGICRYYANGSLDTSFGSGGSVTTNFGGNTAWAYGVVIQSDGKIVVGGSAKTSPTGVYNFALARYLP
jgi:uncharacterized delta-60 repeat protein